MINFQYKNYFFIFVFSLLFFNFLSGSVFAQGPVTENVTVSATVGDVSITPGGSTSGSLGIPHTAVRFSGLAYPNATVTVLKDGKETLSTQANTLGIFSITLEEQFDSTIVYSLFARDIDGNKSLLINYPIVVSVGFLTHLSGIRFAPTILTDKAEVRVGDYLTLTGYSLPSTTLEVFVEGAESKNFSFSSNADGSYKTVLPMLTIPKGDYVVYIKYTNDDRLSKFIKFVIGEVNVPNVDIVENIPGDCNYDRIIDLVDFSVLAFWYGKPNPPACVDTNRDNKIDLIDFSILAFWWTG